MALHLKLRPQTLTNLRRLSSSSTPQSQPPRESGDNDGAAPQPLPFSSYFSDIKERPQSPPCPPRRIPDTPTPPPPLSSSSAAAESASREETLSAFKDLRERLVRFREAGANKKGSMQRLPAFMLELEKEKMKLELKEVRDEFKMSESDSGSARVQVTESLCKMASSSLISSSTTTSPDTTSPPSRMVSPDTTAPPSFTATPSMAVGHSILDPPSTEFPHLNRNIEVIEPPKVGMQIESATKGLNKFKASIRDRQKGNQVHAKEMRLSHVCQEATQLACLSHHSEEGYRIAIDAIREAAKKISAIDHITNNKRNCPLNPKIKKPNMEALDTEEIEELSD